METQDAAYRNRGIRQEMGHNLGIGDPTAINSSLTVSYNKNELLEQDKTGFKCNREQRNPISHT